jgi:chorismate dehydratase
MGGLREAAEDGAVKVGGIDYLNALPLTAYLDPGGEPALRISNHPPSVLASMLREAKLDVALVPVVEYPAREGYEVLPGMSISSYGEVQSIRLYHSRALGDSRRVGLDASSRTSAMLARLLFRDLWKASPEFVEMPPSRVESALRAAGPPGRDDPDAFLLIGDAALRLPSVPGREAVDLGTEWTRWTGLPFVYAFWVWRGGPAPRGLAPRFLRAKAIGLARIDEIAERAAGPAGLDPVQCRHYLNRVIRYDLGHAEIEGLTEFFRRVHAAGLAPPAPAIVLHEDAVEAGVGRT